MNQKLSKEWVSKRLPKRPKDAHKGTFGKLLVFAGSENYPGAAYLSCAAAYRVGAGLVTLASSKEVKIIAAKKLPELTYLSENEAIDTLNNYDALLIGPGWGRGKDKEGLIKKILSREVPSSVIDADGLNILSGIGDWHKQIKGDLVLTPHAGEMVRLTGKKIKDIQKDRVNVVQYWAKQWGTVVVLKGANTVISSPDGETFISPYVNPLLATAGTGDVLAGIMAGLMAQGLKSFDAAAVGVYIHGKAGENLQRKIGNAGMLAGDLLPQIPLVLKELR